MSFNQRLQSGDAVLAEKIRQGDQNAFEEIYDRYHRQLFYMAKKYIKDHDLAEDAVQDIFVKLWTKRAAIDSDRSVRNFLFTMLKNHLLNMIRDQKKKIISAYTDERHLPRQNITEDEILYNEYESVVNRGLEELPERKREVFELKISGHSNAQIAEMLFISIHTVKVQYYHGAKFLRNYLKENADINMLILLILTDFL